MFKLLIFLLLWCILFALSGPLAIVVLLLLPIIGLLIGAFSLLVLLLSACIALLKVVLLAPAYLMGWRAQTR